MVLLLMAALAVQTPAAPQNITPRAEDLPRTITIKVAPDAYQRATDIRDLVHLLREDFENMGKGIVDVKLRDHINAILKRLPKEQ